MTVLDIVTPPDPVLRRPAEPVKEFGAPLQQLIEDMIETMREANGVGLAAPQIGRSLRLAIVETLPEFDDEGQMIEGSRALHVIANPEIVWHSRTVVDGIEGCLSIPGFVGEVTRHEAVRIKAQDRHGKWVKLRVKDWTARIFQHEIDHVNGVLYIDRLTAPENFWREDEYYGSQDDRDEDETVTELV
jgi:peptide deformylase